MRSGAEDVSGGWNAVAADFIACRNPRIGVATVREWASALPVGAAILDLGCGHGTPISATLVEDGFQVCGIDASPDLVAEFRRRLPSATVRCEVVQTSTFYDRRAVGSKQDCTRIVAKISSLAENPRPRGSETLAGYDDRYRIRQGTSRVIYEIDDDASHVTIYKIGHRREVYR